MRSDSVFDSQAMNYGAIAESALGVELRGRVHKVVAGLIHADANVADLGCGIGIDTSWLAPQVRSVYAVDASPEMAALASLRCEPLPNVTVAHGAIETLTMASPVDLVLANFGVVNCVGDLTEFAARLAHMVVTGGRAVIVSMPRWCPIELGIGIAGRNRALLTRRRSGSTSEQGYRGLDIRYASARALSVAFTPHFEMEHAEGLGVLLPPFEQRRWVEDRDWLRGVLAMADRRVARAAASLGIGDHHIAVFRRTP